MFDQLVVSTATPSRTNKRWTIAVSAMGQSLLLGMLILVPLIYTEALPNAMLKTLIVAPPPPAPPQPSLPRSVSHLREIPLSHIVSPRFIPQRVATQTDEPPAVYVEAGASAAETGALLELLRPVAPTAPQRPAEPKTPQRIRQGGLVQAALLVNRVVPEYPAIARTAHVSGTVVLHAIIAKDGTVQELTYVSGPPLLIKAAMDAVHQWRYRPTMLNGESVEVETTIDVVFNLGDS